MTNHLHIIVNTNEPYELKDVIRDFKRHTTKVLLDQITNAPESRREWMLKEFERAGSESAKSKQYKFWQTGSHAIELVTESFTWDKINYIHNNPVEEGFVRKAEDWEYSSASNYQDLDSLLKEVYCIPSMLRTVY